MLGILVLFPQQSTYWKFVNGINHLKNSWEFIEGSTWSSMKNWELCRFWLEELSPISTYLQFFFNDPILFTHAHMRNPPFAASLKSGRHTKRLCALKNGIGGWYKWDQPYCRNRGREALRGCWSWAMWVLVSIIM